uniref:T cell receptor alpha variable 19 n=1 Tax=Macaca fascicularis TaxID=9541 RepID=A0A7N9D9S0_MACFA
MLFASCSGLVILLIIRSSMAQKVTQAQTEISVVEKEDVTLDCVYETRDTTYYLFWYKQPPSGELVFLVRQNSFDEQNEINGRYYSNFQKSTSSFNLTITASQVVDSAVYFCALNEATVRWVLVGALQKPQQETGLLGRDSITDRKKQVGAVSAQVVWQGNLSSIHVQCLDISFIRSMGVFYSLE